MKPLIPHFIQERYLEGQYHGSFRAVTVFADISGFTGLTQQLIQKGGAEGAEVLSEVLNRIFGQLVYEVYSRKGFIVLFAGDAISVVFRAGKPAENAQAALDFCGAALRFFKKEGKLKTRLGNFSVGIKLGVAYGKVNWAIVGDEQLLDGAKKYYFKGPAIDLAAAAEHHAVRGDLIVDASAMLLLPEKTRALSSQISEGIYKVGKHPGRSNTGQTFPPIEFPFEQRVLKNFVRGKILSSTVEGEFRMITAVFLAFRKIRGRKQLDEFMSLVLSLLMETGGQFMEADFGDKGSVLVICFGAPISFENDHERALDFVRRLDKAVISRWGSQDIFKAGVTRGNVFAGFIGGAQRMQYSCLGNIMNLSARLMQRAAFGEILVAAEAANGTDFDFDPLGSLPYKGFKQPVPTFRLKWKAFADARHHASFIGRTKELEQLQNFLDQLSHGSSPGTYCIFGVAGQGKSRLVSELKKRNARSFRWEVLLGDQALKKPLLPLTRWLSGFFGQSGTAYEAEKFSRRFKKLQLLLADFPAESAELERTRPILQALLGKTDSNPEWQALDPQSRLKNIQTSYLNLLRTISRFKPLVLLVEDLQWMDDATMQIVRSLIKENTEHPIAIITTGRETLSKRKADFGPNTSLLDLGQLDKAGCRELATAYLEAIPSPDLEGQIFQLSKGIPFYIEQLTSYLATNDLLVESTEGLKTKSATLKVPGGIRGILIARLDRLSEAAREILMTGAILGNSFEIKLLQSLLRGKMPPADQRQQIKFLSKQKIWGILDEIRLIFAHSLMRDTAYEMMLTGRRRKLHLLAAQAIERIHKKKPAPHYEELAYHFKEADATEKFRSYGLLAAAEAKSHYHNDRALELYGEVLETDPNIEQQLEACVGQSEILLLIGKSDEAMAALQAPLRVRINKQDIGSRKQHFKVHGLLRLSDIEKKRGQTNEALASIEKAISQAQKSELRELRIDAYHRKGSILYQSGKLEESKKWLDRCLEEIGRRKGFELKRAQIYHSLGMVEYYKRDLRQAKKQLYRSLDIMEQHNKAEYNRGLANLGLLEMREENFDEAERCFEKQIKSSIEIGQQDGVVHGKYFLACLHLRRGNYDRVLELNAEMDEVATKIKHNTIKIGNLVNYSQLYELTEQWEKTLSYSRQIYKAATKIGHNYFLAIGANGIANAQLALGKYRAGLDYCERALQIIQEHKLSILQASVVHNVGKARYAIGDFAKAIEIVDGYLKEEMPEKDFAKMHYTSWLLKSGNCAVMKSREKAKEKFLSQLNDTGAENYGIASEIYERLYAVNNNAEFATILKVLRSDRELYEKQ